MSDRIAVMNAGTVVQIGPPTEVYERPRTRFVSEFLGTANIFTGTVQHQAGPDEWSVALSVQPGTHGAVQQPGLAAGQTITLAVRPERLEIGPPMPGRMQATVRDVVFRGAYFAYELMVDGQEAPLFAYAQTRQALATDGMVGLGWSAANATVLADPA